MFRQPRIRPLNARLPSLHVAARIVLRPLRRLR
jgi:hypothetical protein